MAKHARIAQQPGWHGERRLAARAPVELEVDLHHARGVERACRTENLTSEGLFIEGAGAPVGEAVELYAALPYLSGCWRVQGHVVYARDNGVGVRFKTLDAPVRWALGRILGDSGGA